MGSLLQAAQSRASIDVTSTCDRPDPVPLDVPPDLA
jgi:hypothetical protein